MRRRHDRWGGGSLSKIFGYLPVSSARRAEGTVCTGFGGVGWIVCEDESCVVKADAFTEGDGVICWLRYVRRGSRMEGGATTGGTMRDIRREISGRNLGGRVIARSLWNPHHQHPLFCGQGFFSPP